MRPGLVSYAAHFGIVCGPFWFRTRSVLISYAARFGIVCSPDHVRVQPGPDSYAAPLDVAGFRRPGCKRLHCPKLYKIFKIGCCSQNKKKTNFYVVFACNAFQYDVNRVEGTVVDSTVYFFLILFHNI